MHACIFAYVVHNYAVIWVNYQKRFCDNIFLKIGNVDVVSRKMNVCNCMKIEGIRSIKGSDYRLLFSVSFVSLNLKKKSNIRRSYLN